MAYDPQRHDRHSIRLPGYDYSVPGAYFVTICAEGRTSFFGDIANASVTESPAGRMIRDAWNALPAEFPHVQLDAFILMPNHLHGILWFHTGRGEACLRPSSPPSSHPSGTAEGSLARVIQSFKSRTTNAYIAGVKNANWPRFNGRIWQRNYFEHIIRDEPALLAIREYIETNPLRWSDDIENTAGTGRDNVETWVETLLKDGQDRRGKEGRRQASPLPSQRPRKEPM